MKTLKFLVALLFPLMLFSQTNLEYIQDSGIVYKHHPIDSNSFPVDTLKCILLAVDTSNLGITKGGGFQGKSLQLFNGYTLLAPFKPEMYLNFFKQPMDKRYWILGKLIKN